MRSIWHTLRGGKGGLTIWDGDEEVTRSYYDQPEIEGGNDQGGGAPQRALDEGEEYADDGKWYMGRARDEFNRRKRGQPDASERDRQQQRQQEEDPVQWARERRQADADRESADFGPEDYFDGAMRGQRYREDEEVDEFTETMLLVVLCLMVSILLYVRGRWVDRIRREEERRRQAAGGQQGQQGQQGQNHDQGQGANGVFPPPGDPARDQWAVLR